MNNAKKLLILLILVGFAMSLSPYATRAQSIFNYGGRIVNVDYLSCTCTGVVLTVSSPPKGMSSLLWFWGVSGLYGWWMIWKTGNWALGTYVPAAGVCLRPCNTGCCYNGQKNLISPLPLGIGTSLY